MMVETVVDLTVRAEVGAKVGPREGCPHDLNLPTEMEFWEAVSDCSNVVISAAGRHISANSTFLEQQSPVFQTKLAALLDGRDSELYERVRHPTLCSDLPPSSTARGG
jgi:hypothetical protein